MKFISICSGIEAASVAFAPLGWRAIAFSEIEPFPCAVLAHHYPDVPNFGDMTKFREWPEEIFIEADAIVGGPPCQAFSVAGLRAGLSDDRGNLTLTYAELINHADAIRTRAGKQPVVVLYENVPGLLSDKTGAFGSLLGALAGEDGELQPPGKKWTNAGCVSGPKRALAWAVTDAQFFGVAQRRRRVFLIGSARDGFNPAAILFEPDSLRRDTAPSREARQVDPTIPSRCTAGGGLDGGVIESFAIQAGALRTNPNSGPDGVGVQADHAYTLEARAEVQAVALLPIGIFQDSEFGVQRYDTAGTLRAGRIPEHQMVMQPPTMQARGTDKAQNGRGWNDDGTAYTLDTHATQGVAYAFAENTRAEVRLEGGDGQRTGTLSTGGGKPGQGVPCVAYTTKLHNTGSNNAGKIFEERTTCLDANSPPPALLTATQVRRLTVVECERLMGFPDGYTAIPWRKKPASECPDGPRYRALGNSWAVPVAAWMGQRIHRQIAT